MNQEQEVRTDKTISDLVTIQTKGERPQRSSFVFLGFCNPLGFSNQSVGRIRLVFIINLNKELWSPISWQCNAPVIAATLHVAMLSTLIRQLSTFFTSSYKNKDELAEFQEFCETAAHSILKPGLTRWLTLQPCAARVIEQYNPLLLFFTLLVSEKANDSNMKMLSLLKDPFTKCYLEFLVYALEKFNKFNATFQNNQHLIHELQDYVNQLILDLSRSFMDGAYVDSFQSSPLKIDPKKD